MMLQQDEADDYVITTCRSQSRPACANAISTNSFRGLVTMMVDADLDRYGEAG